MQMGGLTEKGSTQSASRGDGSGDRHDAGMSEPSVFLSVNRPVDSGSTKRFSGHSSQEVCPWKVKFSQELAERSAFAARAMFRDASLRGGTRALAREICMMEPMDYEAAFQGSAIKRAKWWMLQRNASVVLGNVGTADDLASRPCSHTSTR